MPYYRYKVYIYIYICTLIIRMYYVYIYIFLLHGLSAQSPLHVLGVGSFGWAAGSFLWSWGSTRTWQLGHPTAWNLSMRLTWIMIGPDWLWYQTWIMKSVSSKFKFKALIQFSTHQYSSCGCGFFSCAPVTVPNSPSLSVEFTCHLTMYPTLIPWTFWKHVKTPSNYRRF